MGRRNEQRQKTRLRILRERTGLSAEKFVRHLEIDLTLSQYYRIEAGDSNTTPAKAAAIASALSELLGQELAVDDVFYAEDRVVKYWGTREPAALAMVIRGPGPYVNPRLLRRDLSYMAQAARAA